MANAPPDVAIGVHLCRGNFKGRYLAEGGYDEIATALFACPGVTHFLLEFDTSRAGDFAPLRHVAADKGVVLGLISSKNPVIETREEMLRRIAMLRVSSTGIVLQSVRNAASPARLPATRLARPSSAPSSRFV